MNAIGDFVRECLASGGLLLALGATLFLPLVAWTLTRPAITLLRANGAPLSRALFFGAFATAPGISFAIGTLTIAIAGYRAGCLHWLGGRIVIGAILTIFTTFIVRASVRAYRRHAEIRLLRASSLAANSRLERAAQHAGLAARCVLTGEPILCIVGIRRPVVLVSNSALDRLSDAQLRASLAHERAHARHRDSLLMAVVAFCADLFPLPVGDLVDGYRNAREFAADRAALRTVDPLDLAQAIYRLATPARRVVGVALADHGVAARVRALLHPSGTHDRRIMRNLVLLLAGQSFTALALLALLVPLSTCRMVL